MELLIREWMSLWCRWEAGWVCWAYPESDCLRGGMLKVWIRSSDMRRWWLRTDEVISVGPTRWGAFPVWRWHIKHHALRINPKTDPYHAPPPPPPKHPSTQMHTRKGFRFICVSILLKNPNALSCQMKDIRYATSSFLADNFFCCIFFVYYFRWNWIQSRTFIRPRRPFKRRLKLFGLCTWWIRKCKRIFNGKW